MRGNATNVRHSKVPNDLESLWQKLLTTVQLVDIQQAEARTHMLGLDNVHQQEPHTRQDQWHGAARHHTLNVFNCADLNLISNPG